MYCADVIIDNVMQFYSIQIKTYEAYQIYLEVFLLDLPGCLATGSETSVKGRMYTSGPSWEPGDARVDRSAWYSSPSVFSNSCTGQSRVWNMSIRQDERTFKLRSQRPTVLQTLMFSCF